MRQRAVSIDRRQRSVTETEQTVRDNRVFTKTDHRAAGIPAKKSDSRVFQPDTAFTVGVVMQLPAFDMDNRSLVRFSHSSLD